MWKRLLASLAASLMLSLCLVSLALGIADLAHVSAKLEMRIWEIRGQAGDRARRDRVRRRLALARRLNPLDADYSADTARFIEWCSWVPSRNDDRYARSRREAGRFYREALMQRPGWGYAWAHFAENRLLQGIIDDALFYALAKAVELAPWEPGVQRKVARVGMAAWERIPENTRSMVKENIRRAVYLDTHRFEIIQMAIQYDWLEHLEPMLTTAAQKKTRGDVMKRLDRR